MLSLYHLLDGLLGLYAFIIIIRIIFEWLVMFGIIDRFNRIVERVGYFLFALTEPSFRILRRYLGKLVPLQVAMVDLTPLIMLLLIWFVRNLMAEYWLVLLL